MATNQYETKTNPTLAGAVGGTVTGLGASTVSQSKSTKSNPMLYAILFVLLLIFGLFITFFVFGK